MLAEICTAMFGTTALMSRIEFAKLTRSGKPCNQPPYYFRDLFRDYQRPTFVITNVAFTRTCTPRTIH